jgi:hypothetical protein
MVDTIGLVGDGDEIHLLYAIEDSFRVNFGEATAKFSTVGDIYEALLARVPTSLTPGLCATSMAFYRVRSALTRIADVQGRVTPSTKLAGLSSMAPNQLLALLSQELGVNRLPQTPSWRGCLGMVVFLAGVIGGLSMAFGHPALWPALLLIPAGFLMVRRDGGGYYSTTVGDLARNVASSNFSHFASLGADVRPAALWRSLCELIAEETAEEIDVSHVTANTRLIG